MADSIREQILTAFATRAAPLSTEPIVRGRRAAINEGVRAVSIFDGEDVATAAKYDIQTLQFPVAIELIWSPGETNASVAANAVMAEVISTMIGANRTFGDLALKTELTSATPSYPTEGGELLTMTVIFTITYETKLGDPYTKP